MSVALFIVLEQEILGLDTRMNGKALAHAESDEESHPTLTTIAQELGVKPLIEYLSQSPEEVLGFMDIEPEDATPEILANVPAEQWFPTEAGLTTVRAYVPYLRANPSVVPNVEWLLDDLADIERILLAAQEHNVRWHAAMDL